MADDGLWYKDAVFYELSVRSFQDGYNDGVGDFKGLTSRLDYLQELGIDCIWLLPFFPSPRKDDGYDIADYRGIHAEYGTMEDFQTFLDCAHDRGMRVIADLVMNHTSDQHPWFQRAVQSPPGSPERNYYVWSDTDQLYKDARIIFLDTERSNWAWHPEAQQYYWHRFYSQQPDLNFESPEVRREMLDIFRFWLDRGLDGFRCDAVPYLFEEDGTNCENLPRTHEYFKELRADPRLRVQGPRAAGRGQPVADRRSTLLRRRRRVSHGLPLPLDASPVHGPSARRTATRSSTSSRAPRRSPTPASGESSCETTTS